MRLTQVAVEATLRQNEGVQNLLDGATIQERSALIKTVHHMMVSYARFEVELTKVVSIGPPEDADKSGS